MNRHGTARPRPDHWTPDLVRQAIVDALRWVHHAGPRAGPSPIRSAMPEFCLTMEERLALGWDSVVPADDEDRPSRQAPTPDQISRHEDALLWVARIIRPKSEEMARAVNAACAAEAWGASFSRLVRERGLHRSRAYTLRDRGFSILSYTLDQRGVPVWPMEER